MQFDAEDFVALARTAGRETRYHSFDQKDNGCTTTFDSRYLSFPIEPPLRKDIC